MLTEHTVHISLWRELDEYQKYPVHIQKVQTLIPADYPNRVHLLKWYLDKIYDKTKFSSIIPLDRQGIL